jgi:hypothetical protein
MKPTNFKHRGKFEFSPHRYEIGNPIIQNKALENNLFLLKLYKLREDEYPAFYQFHLDHYLNQNPNGEGQVQHRPQCCQTIQRRS